MIHVCFGLHDKTGRYSKFTGTAMLSLFDNTTSEVTVHILHDNYLTEDNRNKFSRLAAKYNQLVKFYNVEELCADKITEIRNFFPEVDKTRFSIGTFYRFFIAHILPAEVEKVIYLDADIIVNLDLAELWQIELGDKPVGAIPNLFQIKDEKASVERTEKNMEICKAGLVRPEDYFNAGVLLMNLRFMRNADEILLNGMKFLEEHNQLQFLDQDLLNYCFSTSYLKLPVKFNRFVMLARPENELTTGKMIYHYAGGKVGLGLDMIDPFNRLWWSYFIRTPWFNVDTIDKILKNIERLDIAQEESMLKLSAVPTGKTRAFVVDEENADRIERKFSVRDEEEIIIIDYESEDNLRQLIDLMNNARDKKFFFIGTPKIASKLKKSGFAEGKEFFNVSEFYSPTWTGRTNYSPSWKSRTNNYNLILAM